MDTNFCVDALEEALRKNGEPRNIKQGIRVVSLHLISLLQLC